MCLAYLRGENNLLADPRNQTGTGRMRPENERSSRANSPANGGSGAWEYPNASANEYEELGVQELLHGLEAESHKTIRPARYAVPQLSDPVFSDPDVICHACQRRSPAGQRFCGYCGSKFSQVEPPVVERSVQEKARETWPFTPANPVNVNVRVDDATRQSRPARDPDQDFDELRDPELSENELQFLRYKVASNSWEHSAGRGWKVAVVLLVLAGVSYAGYRVYVEQSSPPPVLYRAEPQEAPSAAEPNSSPAATATPPAAAPGSKPDEVGEQAKSATDSTVDQGSASARTARELKPETNSPAHLAVPSTSQEPAEEAPPAATTLPVPQASVDGGVQELQTAQRYLAGSGAQRDPSEAAKWLWRAVGKQNGPAILLLSDLYAKGEGVSRNCDQARLLLLTAVKKKVPDSATQLRRLELSGCQ